MSVSYEYISSPDSSLLAAPEVVDRDSPFMIRSGSFHDGAPPAASIMSVHFASIARRLRRSLVSHPPGSDVAMKDTAWADVSPLCRPIRAGLAAAARPHVETAAR